MSFYRAKLDLTEKIALVTGAAQGIGAACTQALAEMGAKVYITDLNEQAAKNFAATLPENSIAGIYALDVTNYNQLSELANSIPPLDVLVCNAGIVTNTAFSEMEEDEWLKVIDVNLNGVFRTCRAFGPRMSKNGKGSIINIGSMSGIIVNTPQPQAHYNASKAAVHQLTKSLAVEWASQGIRVNSVAPTYISTPLVAGVAEKNKEMVQTWLQMTPMGRLGETHEIASLVQFLASDASSLMTGSVISIDGGYTCL